MTKSYDPTDFPDAIHEIRGNHEFIARRDGKGYQIDKYAEDANKYLRLAFDKYLRAFERAGLIKQADDLLAAIIRHAVGVRVGLRRDYAPHTLDEGDN